MKKVAGIALVCLTITLFTRPLIAEQKKTYTKTLVCAMIIDALGKTGDPEAAPILIRGLKSKDYFIRAYAAQALGRLGDKKNIHLLMNLVNDKNYLVRIASVKSLIRLGVSGMKMRLLEYLRDGDPAVRTAAISHLADLDKTFLPNINKMIATEKDPMVLAKAVEQLDKTARIESPGKGRAGGGEAGVDPLLETASRALEDSNWQVRQAACMALARLKNKKAIPLLIEHLGDNSPFVRAAAKETLAKLGETSLIKFFWQDLNETNSVLKASSFLALAYLNDISVIPVLLKESVASETPTLVRKEAIRALIILKPYVTKLVDDSLSAAQVNNSVSSDNLEIGYRINGTSLSDIFVAALKDPQNPLYNDAPFVLKELNDPGVLPALREALAQGEPDIVAASAYALGELGDRHAAEALIKASKKYSL